MCVGLWVRGGADGGWKRPEGPKPSLPSPRGDPRLFTCLVALFADPHLRSTRGGTCSSSGTWGLPGAAVRVSVHGEHGFGPPVCGQAAVITRGPAAALPVGPSVPLHLSCLSGCLFLPSRCGARGGITPVRPVSPRSTEQRSTRHGLASASRVPGSLDPGLLPSSLPSSSLLPCTAPSPHCPVLPRALRGLGGGRREFLSQRLAGLIWTAAVSAWGCPAHGGVGVTARSRRACCFGGGGDAVCSCAWAPPSGLADCVPAERGCCRLPGSRVPLCGSQALALISVCFKTPKLLPAAAPR